MCSLVLQDSVQKMSSKKYIYLARKIIYTDQPEIKQTFLEKSLHHNFVQFLAQELGMT
jgi:hypothetical protein